MGLKLEFILIFLVVIVLAISSKIELHNKNIVNKISTKEMKFTDTIFTEVNTEKIIDVSYGTHGVRDNGILTVQNFKYHSDSVKLLSSDEAIYKGDKIYLNYNIDFNKELGSNCYSEHAEYNKSSKILDITSPFKAIEGKDIAYGDTMRYFSDRKEMFASRVNIMFYTKEK